jgi:excisionase family DNA binding protein
MTDSQYISVRETAQILGTSEKKVMDLIEEGKLQAYKIANQFLRLKKSEIMALRNSGAVVKEVVVHPYTRAERITDFFYFNDFYLISSGVIALLLFIIFQK